MGLPPGRFLFLALLVAAFCATDSPLPLSAQPAGPGAARPAQPAVVTALQQSIERARQRLEARDANGVLAYVSEHYRSAGLTKADIGEQLHALCALYEQLRVRVTMDQVRIVDGMVWVYTTGDVAGRLPFVGWVPALSWTNQPEVARHEGSSWRLFGFQD